MADSSATEGLDELVTKLVNSMTATSATETAILKMIQDVMPEVTTSVTDLIKNNAFSADIAAENLKIQKAITQTTIDAINALAPKTDSSSSGD